MVKYFLIAFGIHSLLFLNFYKHNTLGNPNISIKRNIPISYNIISKETKIDGIQKIKAQENLSEKISEKIKEKSEKKENEKISKNEPEIKSKMSNNKEKLREKQKQSLNKENKNQKEFSGKQNSEDIFTKNGNFTVNSDGSYTAISSKGIEFEIIKEVTPDYPRQAEAVRFKQTVVVEARFLVDLNGNVEDIQIVKSYGKFGFDKEVIKALKKWKFKPITYQGKK